MKVLVLGCGPAGLIATHAAVGMGASVKVLSKPRKSFMNGAQYLHRPIPGINCGDPFEVDYLLKGTAEGYRFKVYGRQWDGTVSPEDMTASHTAWDIRTAYDSLWDLYSDLVQPWEATPASLAWVINTGKPDLVVSTVPAQLLCTEGHTFRATKVWSTSQAYGLDEYGDRDNVVVCNGEESPRWYRSSRIQGHENTEWPDGPAKPPLSPLWEVLKPTGNNCTCFPDVLRTGRYGEWKKGVLSHETFYKVSDAIIDRKEA